MSETCETCRYWLQTSSEKEGLCRRHPPKVVAPALNFGQDALVMTSWPEVMACEWCGEHKPKPLLAFRADGGEQGEP